MPSPMIFIFAFSLLFPFVHFASIPLNFDGIHEFSDPSQKSDLPLAADPKMFNESSWSTYRPQCYFGLKNRRPDSPMFGIIWYQQREKTEKGQINLRHWAMHEDNIVFMWHKHNGRSFGSQQIIDGDFEMKTEWFNFGSSSWMARLNLTRPKWGNAPKALILYLALQDEISSFENNSNLNGKNGEINFLEGKSPAVGGKFSMKIRKMKGNWDISKLALNFEPFLDMAKVGGIIKLELKMQPNGNLAFENSNRGGKSPNFVALQINFEENDVLDILFQKDGDLGPSKFEEGFGEKEAIFRAQFKAAFPILADYPPIYHQMGQAALSNLLGGIGVWHGNMWIRSPKFDPPYSSKVYGPNSLISAVPSRTGFPRGFLWDEGHHNLLIHKFDPALSLEIIGAYLDLMNIDGWIPREIALGSETEARIPADFIVQEDWVANPPTFFLFLREFMADEERTQNYLGQLKRFYPRMKKLYIWLRESQKGPLMGTFRWHGRNATSKSMLNPGALDSGLDDYPRASHPTSGEYHVDLLAWMAMASSMLEKLAEFAGDEEFLPKIRKEAAHLNDIEQMDKLHWSERRQQYCDFGLHSDAVDLVEVEDGEGKGELVRRILLEPHYQLVENVNGYANLFPLLMRLLPPKSPKLAKLLRHISDPQQLWTPFGLRSISTWSPYYGSWNDKFSAPYWRGPIWININYYAISALKYYSLLKGPYQAESARLYAELRANLLRNMADQYAKTGFIWEHYNDLDGHGGGNHPFTGWSALVLNILAENF